MMDELISREAAIDALGERPLVWTDNDDYALGERSQYDMDKLAIETVSSVTPKEQPEIIRCKDCKYRMPYDWMFSEVWQSQNMDDYPDDEIGCQYCDMSMTADDFCSRAERREEGEQE